MSQAEREQSFVHQRLRNRAAIVAAGPIANFILAIVIFAAIFSLHGRQSTSPRVDSVQTESAAAAAGFQPGDLVVTIDGRAVATFADMQRVISISAGQTLEVVVDRGGVQKTLKATPALREIKDNFGNVHRIGVLGISRSMAAGDRSTADRRSADRDPTWGRGNLVHRRSDAVLHRRAWSSAGRRRIRSEVRRESRRSRVRSGRAGLATAGRRGRGRALSACRGAVGLDRAPQSVSGSVARRRSPFVLRN